MSAAGYIMVMAFVLIDDVFAVAAFSKGRFTTGIVALVAAQALCVVLLRRRDRS